MTRLPLTSSASLEDVLITHELDRRGPRSPDYKAENLALGALARALATDPESILQALADVALDLCRAESAGISLLEPNDAGGVFRWSAIAGRFAPNRDGTIARALSPCGAVLDRNAVLLFDRPARHFFALAEGDPPIYEKLFVPFNFEDEPIGAVWAIAHDPDRRFDSEDARLLKSLAEFAAAGYQTQVRAQQLERSTRMLNARIAESERAEQALRDSEERYRTLFESIDEGFCILEPIYDDSGRAVDHRFLETNPAFKRHTGFVGAAGKTARELVPGLEAHWYERYGRIARTGIPERFVEESPALGRWFDVDAFRIGDAKERKVAVLFNDITERRRNEESLQQADRRKDEFLATLAHELRNPLAPIQSGLDVLRLSSDGSAMTARVTDMMQRQMVHMGRLVDDLLDVSRITRGKITLRKATTDAVEAVRSAIETSSPSIRAGERQVVVELPREPLYVNADPVRLVQVVSNLLNNAAKYTGEQGRIRVAATQEGGRVHISVRDDGVGIAPAMLRQVFGMFTQADSRAEGLGIGLTLVRSLVELHGGTVEARSAGLGHGSEFVVYLPLVSCAPGERVPAPPDERQDMRARRVLVVDDNQDAAESLRLLLEVLGADVAAVNDGRGALEQVNQLRPEVVLLDIGMPDMDGYEVARRIRAQGSAAPPLLVAVTGWGQEEDRRRARAAGFDHHLTKPVEMAALARVFAMAAAH